MRVIDVSLVTRDCSNKGKNIFGDLSEVVGRARHSNVNLVRTFSEKRETAFLRDVNRETAFSTVARTPPPSLPPSMLWHDNQYFAEIENLGLDLWWPLGEPVISRNDC